MSSSSAGSGPSGRRGRKLFSMMLPSSLLMAMALGAGCKPDICKDPGLTAAQRCTDCKPKDDELLSRLDPTQLPWPVRKSVERCADQIHAGDSRAFVTKQALRDCTNGDPELDGDTKQALTKLINQSNLLEQVDLEAHHALCLANTGANYSAPPAAANPTVPPAAPDSPTVPPAAASPATPGPGAAPAAQPSSSLPPPPQPEPFR